MKKIIGVILAIILVCCICVPAFAENEPKTDGSVYAKIIDKTENVLKTDIVDKQAELKSDNGTGIKAENVNAENSDKKKLAVLPVNDGNAKDWLNDSVKDSVNGFEAYNIFIEDKNGEKESEDNGAILSFTPGKKYENPTVLFVDKNGNVIKQDVTSENGVLKVNKIKDGYYVIGEAVKQENNPQDSNGENPDATSPQTGFEGNEVMLATATLLLAAAVLMTLKKKRHN